MMYEHANRSFIKKVNQSKKDVTTKSKSCAAISTKFTGANNTTNDRMSRKPYSYSTRIRANFSKIMLISIYANYQLHIYIRYIRFSDYWLWPLLTPTGWPKTIVAPFHSQNILIHSEATCNRHCRDTHTRNTIFTKVQVNLTTPNRI